MREKKKKYIRVKKRPLTLTDQVYHCMKGVKMV